MISCTRRIQFSAGHRVYRHESKCANVHGHNYIVYIYARASTLKHESKSAPHESKPELDSIGRVIDFSVLKEQYGRWIDTSWDHGMILWKEDPLVGVFQDTEHLVGMKTCAMDFNPTAEEMARWLLDLGPILMIGTGVEVWKIQLWETENCFAEVSL